MIIRSFNGLWVHELESQAKNFRTMVNKVPIFHPECLEDEVFFTNAMDFSELKKQFPELELRAGEVAYMDDGKECTACGFYNIVPIFKKKEKQK